MRSKDFKAKMPARVLLIGEDSNLQWTDTVTEYAMFADYYFKPTPKDNGERSRKVEAKNLFNYIRFLTNSKYQANEIYITNLCNDYIEPAPKGKRNLIPKDKARQGYAHIKEILEKNQEIEVVFIMSLQTNYWMQHFGFYLENQEFLYGAQARRVGLSDIHPYYQPVNPKVFNDICFRIFRSNIADVKVVPILPVKDFPFNEKNTARFAAVCEELREFFSFLRGGGAVYKIFILTQPQPLPIYYAKYLANYTC